MTAKTQVVCYTLTRKSFDSLLGPIQDVWRFEALRKVPILFSLSNRQLFGLAQCMKYHTLQAGQVVFKKGEPGEPTFPSNHFLNFYYSFIFMFGDACGLQERSGSTTQRCSPCHF